MNNSKRILCLIVLILCFRLHMLKSEYDRILQRRMFTTVESGLEYHVWQGAGDTTLHIGDLLGTNVISAGYLKEFRPPNGQKAVVVPSIHPLAFQEVTPESFLGIISNDHDVVLVDNFCTGNWEMVKTRAWYHNTSLSPGPYCLSEPQTRLIDRLIKQYGVKRVKIYADNKMYVRMISTFLQYLEGLGILYQIVYRT